MALQSTTALATITLQVAAPLVTFSNIPNTYRDLVLVVRANTTSSFDPISMVFNSDTVTARNGRHMTGNGSTASSGTYSDLRLGDIYSTFNEPSLFIATIADYSATDKHKVYLSRSNQVGNYATAIFGRWASNNAVSSISLSGQYSGSFSAGSTFSLYGRIA